MAYSNSSFMTNVDKAETESTEIKSAPNLQIIHYLFLEDLRKRKISWPLCKHRTNRMTSQDHPTKRQTTKLKTILFFFITMFTLNNYWKPFTYLSLVTTVSGIAPFTLIL